MAAAVEEDVEYESDPEEFKRSLAMRRREASDDEEGEGEGRDKRVNRRVGICSDDSDGQGGVAEYDDEEELDGVEEEEVYEEEEEDVEEGDEVQEAELYKERDGEGGVHRNNFEGSEVIVKESEGDFRAPLDAEVHSGNKDGEEKKENEPFAVPTAGAFYMHDDRFRDNAGGRHRRLHGGRRLWESKDDRKWGHDKFEEMTMQERHYEEGRRVSKGSYRARGKSKSRSVDGGVYGRGNRKGYSNSGNQGKVPKGGVRGRGPQKFEPTNRNNGLLPRMQNKQPRKPLDKTSHGSSGRTFTPNTNVESDPVPARKQVVSSNLNSASPPFYPSGSSNKDITSNGDGQTGNTGRTVRPGVSAEGFSIRQNNAIFRGKNVVESFNLDKLCIDESVNPALGKPLNNFHIHPSGSSGVNASQCPQPRGPGRAVAISVRMNYEPTSTHNKLSQRSGSGSQASSPPKTSATTSSFDSGEMDAASESGKAKGALVGKGKGGAQGRGRGSFPYGRAQIMGASEHMGAGHGDQNFPATPAFLPVMQFGGQHRGGIGVPAVGMAFPGYVAQPQLGLGNSEMTWLPVLAGAAGALGATYCSPYLATDNAYNARQPGQTSTMGTSSKENNANKTNIEWKPLQRTELVSDEFGQRQKPRRYSEMNFGQ